MEICGKNVGLAGLQEELILDHYRMSLEEIRVK
jgi:hypothetical protein